MSAIRKILLAGDIGGTKTFLRFAKAGGDILAERRYDSQSYPGLDHILAEFVQAHPPLFIHAACFGVAGPVSEGRAEITNLPWKIDAAAIGSQFGIPHVRLINDFQAVAYGIEALRPDDLATLQTGEPQMHGVRAVIGAGTGLGEGFMVWREGHYEAMPSEGSHADFAPADAQQIELLRYLARHHGHVSYERLVSGAGLVSLFDFLRETGDTEVAPDLRAAMEAGDSAAAISRFALGGADRLAAEALDLFIRIYGAEAGNLALKVLARGGVYVAGGIAPQIIGKLQEGEFLRAFGAKGRFAGLLATIPVHVVLDPKVGLLGAARVAERCLAPGQAAVGRALA